MCRLWEDNRAPTNRLKLLEQLDYLHKLSSQLEWQQGAVKGQVRVVYSKSGKPTAAILYDKRFLWKTSCFGFPAKTLKKPITCWLLSTVKR